MKKYLPLILFFVGLLVVLVAFFVVKGRKGSDALSEDEGVVAELPLDKKPIASLTPSEDGHWLTLDVKKLVVKAETMDYELLYELPDGRTQGVPGTVDLDGDDIQRKLLLGSESSGKFRYDEGVEKGTLTLRFRDSKGKLIAKMATDFHLQSGINEVSSVDGSFAYKFDEDQPEAYFVTMSTFGVERAPGFELADIPYAVFSSVTSKLAGRVSMKGENSYLWIGSDWVLLEDNKSENIGFFISAQ